MGAAAYVGRVGALAVAIGVGVAVSTGYGVASADNTPGPDPSGTPSIAADSQPGPTTKSLTDDSSVGTVTSPQLSASKSTASKSTATNSTKSAKPGGADLGRAIRRFVEKGVTMSTGGALHSARTTENVPAARPPVDEPDENQTPANPDDTVLAGGSDDVAAPTPPPASVRSSAVPTKSSSRFDVTAARPQLRTAAPAAQARVVEAVAEKVSTGKDAAQGVVETVLKRAADPVIPTISAAQAPVSAARTGLVEMAAPAAGAATAAPLTVTGLLSGVLAAIGLGAVAPSSPIAPAGSPVALALLAWGSRREAEKAVSGLDESATTGATTLASARVAAVPAAVVTTPVTTRIGWVTGENSINRTISRFGIAGTDVGVMWDNGITGDNPATTIVEQREVLIAFGDTFSQPGMTGVWRMNTLFRSPDRVLSDGLYVPDGIVHDPGAYSGSPMTNPNFAREIIGNYRYGIGPEVTMIPTAGISVAGAGVNGATRQYVNFMAVKSWDTPGRWTTNYSAIAYSDDNGQNWTVVPQSSVRAAAAGRSTVPFVAGNQNFQQGAYVKPPAGSADAAAGWVYSYGTPAGRGGTVYVSRVNEKDILDQTKYQYWNGSSWVANKPSAATPILPGTTKTSFFGLIKKTTYPSVSEMSVQYNPYLKKYVMLYADQNNNVVMRTSATPQGTWSAPTTLATSTQYPGLYAPMIHPWSGTGQLLKADGTPEDPQYLYWNLSQWNEYNVALMRTDLSRV